MIIQKRHLTYLVLLCALIILIFFLKNNKQLVEPETIAKEIKLDEEGNYNLYGQKISQEEAEGQFNNLPAEEKEKVKKEDIVDALATQKLLLEEAEKEEIQVTDEEVDGFIQQSMTQFSMSEEEYQEKLDEYGITDEEYKEEVKEQILISKLINQSINPDEYYVSDKEVDDFIEEHKEEYQDVFDENPGLEEQLKSRIKSQMRLKKQQDLIITFINSLKQ